MPVVIGLVGKPRAGKGTITLLLKEIVMREIGPSLTLQSFRFSDALREMCDEQGILKTRDNLQKIAQDIEQTGIENGDGPGALSREVQKRVGKLKTHVVIVDGVRWLTDETMVRSFEDNFLIFVTASPETRHERGVAAGENVGDAVKSFEGFVREDNDPNERFIEEIGARADIALDNNTEDATFEHLRKPLLSFFRREMFPTFVEKL